MEEVSFELLVQNPNEIHKVPIQKFTLDLCYKLFDANNETFHAINSRASYILTDVESLLKFYEYVVSKNNLVFYQVSSLFFGRIGYLPKETTENLCLAYLRSRTPFNIDISYIPSYLRTESIYLEGVLKKPRVIERIENPTQEMFMGFLRNEKNKNWVKYIYKKFSKVMTREIKLLFLEKYPEFLRIKSWRKKNYWL